MRPRQTVDLVVRRLTRWSISRARGRRRLTWTLSAARGRTATCYSATVDVDLVNETVWVDLPSEIKQGSGHRSDGTKLKAQRVLGIRPASGTHVVGATGANSEVPPSRLKSNKSQHCPRIKVHLIELRSQHTMAHNVAPAQIDMDKFKSWNGCI